MKRVKAVKGVVVMLAAAGLLASLPSVARAKKDAARIPVVVTFDADAPLDHFRGSALRDERWDGRDGAWQYLTEDVVGAVQSFERLHGFRAKHVYSHAVRGFAAELTAEQIVALESEGNLNVEPEQTYTINAQTLPWGINRVDADSSSTLAGNGSGSVTSVNIYVIDTGVGSHPDINRVGHLNFTGDGNNADCHGHGTHVAGTIAARDNASDVVGVVPGAPVTGVKVLGCDGSGSTSNIIKGIDWVTANGRRPGVANMSLGGGVSTALDDAVRRSAAAGFVYALAAGNSGANACNSSPARAGAGSNNGIITTAATDSSNREASFSNFGSCVDLWGPGVSVLSTRLGGGTTTMSGTSMASPHAAGVAALFLSGSTGSSPSSVESRLKTDTLSFGTASKDGRAIRIVNARNY